MSVALKLAERGYSVVYRGDRVNHCPGCDRSHWIVGRVTAECAFCATAIPARIADRREIMSIGVSDHALLRFLERAGGLDIEGLRKSLASRWPRPCGGEEPRRSDYLIRSDGMLYVVRGETLTTVLEDKGAGNSAAALAQVRRA
jgi:hypothetical protein